MALVAGYKRWGDPNAANVLYKDWPAKTQPATANNDTIQISADPLSGFNNDFNHDTNIGTANAFTLKTNVGPNNNLKAMLGANSGLACAGLGPLLAGTNPFTLHFVTQQAAAGSGCIAGWSVGSHYGIARNWDTNQTPKAASCLVSEAMTYAVDTVVGSANWAVITIVGTATTVTVRTNGSTGGSVTTTSRVAFTMAYLGGLFRPSGNPNGTAFLDGYLGDDVWYDTTLSNASIIQNEGFLKQKWGLGVVTAPSPIATSYRNRIGVEWAAVANATSYLIERSPNGTTGWGTLGTTTRLVWTDDQAAGTWYYRISGSDGTYGPVSSVVNGTPTGATITRTNMGPLARHTYVPDLALANNAACSQLTDDTGRGFHMVTAGADPVNKTAIQNGLAMVLGNGSTQYLKGDAWVANVFRGNNLPYSISMVLKANSIAGGVSNVQTPFTIADSTEDNLTVDMLLEPGYSSWMINSRDINGAFETIIAGGRLDTTAHLLTCTYDGSTCSLYDGPNLVASAAGDIGAGAFEWFSYWAHRRNVSNNEKFNGYIGEDFVYYFALTAADVTGLYGLVASTWGLPAAGSIAFDPRQLANTAAYFDDGSMTNGGTASLGNTIATVYNSGVRDKFPLASLGDNFNAVNAPTLSQAINSLYTINFGAGNCYYKSQNGASTDSRLTTRASGAGQALTIAGVFKMANLTGTQTLFSFANTGTTAKFVFQIASGSYSVVQTNNAGTSNTVSGGTPDTTKHSFCITYNGTTVTIKIDGNQVASGNLSGGTCTFNRLAIGAFDNGTASNFFTGDLGMFYLNLSALNSVDTNKVFTFAHDTWNIPTTFVNTVSDILSISDINNNTRLKTFIESILLSDNRNLIAYKSVLEALSITDTKLLTVVKSLVDLFQVSDTKFLSVTKTLSESLQLSDNKFLTAKKVLSEAFSISDSASEALLILIITTIEAYGDEDIYSGGIA